MRTSRRSKLCVLDRGVAVAIVASIFLCSSAALARPCGEIPADVAFREATLVVKGWFEYTRTEDAAPPGSDSTSIIRVDRVLKGATSRTEISVTHFLCGLESPIAMRPDRPLIAFVTASGNLVGGTAVLPASRLTSGTEISRDAKANLRAELLLAATDSDPVVVRAALGALAELDGATSAATLKQAVGNADLGVRVRALTWLTRFGDADAFRQLAEVLSAWPFTPFAIPRTIRDDEGASLAIAEHDVMRVLGSFAVPDFALATGPTFRTTEFVHLIETITRLDDIFLRRDAFQALRHSNPAFFPLLVDALADPDEDIRHNAIFALCMAVNAADLPCGPSYFEADEEKYLYRIRAWWKTRAERSDPAKREPPSRAAPLRRPRRGVNAGLPAVAHAAIWQA